METSAALGFGFRCGFLGLLHLEVIRDRIEREYDIDLITTAPSVIYQIYQRDGTMTELHNPADMPDPATIDHIEEPRIKATILVPDEYLGDVLKLCQDRRGIQLDLTYAGARAMVVYDLPLNEVVFDFYDRLKSVTKGYASFDYQMIGYREDYLVKMSILVNDEPVDALSMMVHRDRAEGRGRAMCEKLKELIPRHMFKIPIQAAIGGRVIARETLSAMRKDVTAKCYGGDATRKKKLLEKQKAGKKKMRQFGKVEIPQEAFINALKMELLTHGRLPAPPRGGAGGRARCDRGRNRSYRRDRRDHPRQARPHRLSAQLPRPVGVAGANLRHETGPRLCCGRRRRLARHHRDRQVPGEAPVKLTYDPSANVAYIRLRERQGDVETIELTSDFLVDIDETGTVCGIELLNANDQLARGDDGKLIFVNALSGGQAELDVA